MMEEAAYFDREYFELHAGKARYLRYLLGLLARHGVAAGRVLDVGSGYGFFLTALDAAGYRAIGLERSPHANFAARRRTRAGLVTRSAEQPLPFADRSFRAVTLFDVIEHLVDYPFTLRECRRVLAPGGLLFVVTLNARSVARPLLGRQWSWHKDPTHVHMFSPAMLRDGLADAGLEVELLATFFNFCSVGESTPFLKPLRLLGRVVQLPAGGDSLLAVGRRPRTP